MNKKVFLKRLNEILTGLDESEKRRALEYYAEAIDDRVENGMSELEAVRELGAPETVAKRILEDAGIDPDAYNARGEMVKHRRNQLIYILLGAVILAMVVIRTFSPILYVDEYEMKTMSLPAGFTGLDIDMRGFDTIISLSRDGTNSLTYPEGKHGTVEAAVNKHNTLEIKQIRKMNWLEQLLLNVKTDCSVTLALTEEAYQMLKADSNSGNVVVEENFSFDSAKISTASGDVVFYARANDFSADTASGNVSLRRQTGGNIHVGTASGSIYVDGADLTGGVKLSAASGSVTAKNVTALALTANTTSGNVSLSGVRADRVSADTTSGSVSFSGVRAEHISAETTSGRITMSDAVAADQLNAESTSGNVNLNECDGKKIVIETTSGKIHAELLTPKRFSVSSGSGKVSCPASEGDETCRAKSGSGNIEITVSGK